MNSRAEATDNLQQPGCRSEVEYALGLMMLVLLVAWYAKASIIQDFLSTDTNNYNLPEGTK